jgi:hypothetical protein
LLLLLIGLGLFLLRACQPPPEKPVEPMAPAAVDQASDPLPPEDANAPAEEPITELTAADPAWQEQAADETDQAYAERMRTRVRRDYDRQASYGSTDGTRVENEASRVDTVDETMAQEQAEALEGELEPGEIIVGEDGEIEAIGPESEDLSGEEPPTGEFPDEPALPDTPPMDEPPTDEPVDPNAQGPEESPADELPLEEPSAEAPPEDPNGEPVDPNAQGPESEKPPPEPEEPQPPEPDQAQPPEADQPPPEDPAQPPAEEPPAPPSEQPQPQEPGEQAEPPAPDNPSAPPGQPAATPAPGSNSASQGSGQNAGSRHRYSSGNWRPSISLQDPRTGLPLKIEYDIKDGNGKVKLRRHDGSVCTGDAGSAVQGGKAIISATSNIRCPDGTNFGRPTLECPPGSQRSQGGKGCVLRYSPSGPGVSVGAMKPAP